MTRPGGGFELVIPTPPLRYFVNVVPSGGPQLILAPNRWRFYTGEPVNPLVMLRYPDGGWPDDVAMDLTIDRPTGSLGTILSTETLREPINAGGDTIPARQATIAALEQAAGGPLVGRTTETLTMADTPEETRGRFEGAAVFGKELKDLTTAEGHYQLHFRATYGGPTCEATRELLATLLVEVGIDPDHSPTTLVDDGPRPDGKHTGTITIVPGDRYGNKVGPGKPDTLDISGTTGTTVTGPAHDNGDGSYTVPVTWDPTAGTPGIVVGQPDRPPITISPGGTTPTGGQQNPWPCLWWVVVAVLALLVLILFVLLVT